MHRYSGTECKNHIRSVMMSAEACISAVAVMGIIPDGAVLDSGVVCIGAAAKTGVLQIDARGVLCMRRVDS